MIETWKGIVHENITVLQTSLDSVKPFVLKNVNGAIIGYLDTTDDVIKGKLKKYLKNYIVAVTGAVKKTAFQLPGE